MTVESRKKALHYFFAKVVDPLGFKFTPDDEMMNFLLEQEVKLEDKNGIPYCPCQPKTNDRTHNMTVVCPCIPFHQDHFNAMKRCWCGLFVHKDVSDPSKLRQFGANEVKSE
jgi:ferredoxin-thioredoxin reductase catalytic chain